MAESIAKHHAKVRFLAVDIWNAISVHLIFLFSISYSLRVGLDAFKRVLLDILDRYEKNSYGCVTEMLKA